MQIPRVSRYVSTKLGRPLGSHKKKSIELFDIPLSDYAMNKMKEIEARIVRECRV